MNKEVTPKDIEGYIKGDLAESIVSRLFRDLGFHVKYNGIEVVHPDFIYLMDRKLIDPSVIRKHSLQADFIIAKEKDETHPTGFSRDIEVKFRKDSELSKKDLVCYPDEMHFILVDKEHFWSVSKEQLIKEETGPATLKFKSLTLLEHDEVFCFSDKQKDLITLYKPYLQVIAQISFRAA